MSRLLIVDDHRLIFEGLRGALPETWQLDWARTLGDARRVLAGDKVQRILLDLSLGSESGLSALSEFASAAPTYVLTMHDSPSLARQARDLGAKGYFLKDDSLDALLRVLEAPLSSTFWTSPGLTPLDESVATGYSALTSREQQVFVLLAEDLGYKDVASRLGISAKTVNVHRDNLMKKLGLHSFGELIDLARHLGLIVR
ncbi:MAG: response regulator transcription factor [Spirochaetales bacterium]